LAILAALLSFGCCLRADAVIDSRNFIEGVLDAPVYDVDGVTKLEGNWFFVALLTLPSDGVVSPFQTGTNAGYWVPRNWTLRGATPGQRIWVQVMVFSPQPCFELCPNILWGSSKPFSIVLQETPTPLTGLESFNLGPQWFGVRRQGGDLVISWLNQGDAATYSLEATTDLGAAGSWNEFWRGSGYYPAGNLMSVTNAITGEHQFFRLRMWRH
jgi:hypothetical protein